MYFRRKTSAGRAYLQIVESRRDGDQVRQQVIATLGRFEDLQASGQLERLVRSGARFATKAKGGSPVGAITLARTQTGNFPARQIELLKTFADQAAIAIQNASLLNELREETTP